ncbi:YheC/YheD family protein [Paenibacillus sp. CMAA1364]
MSSKWAKTKVLMQNDYISKHIPITHKYSHETLQRMLQEFSFVFLKPEIGTYGRGVLCIEKIADKPEGNAQSNINIAPSGYKLRYAKETHTLYSIDDLIPWLDVYTGNRSYLIQQGIQLLQYKNRPFDLRVLTQKSPNQHWVTTGIIGRVAAPHKIITNYHSGGKCQTFETLMTPYKKTMEQFTLQQSIKKLGIAVAQQLQKKYPNIKEIGLDIAIDKDGSYWILEVNTLPAIFPFKKFIPDKDVYQRIHRYAVSYGRFAADKKTK